MHFVGAQLGFVFGAQLHKCDWNSEPREAADTEPTQKREAGPKHDTRALWSFEKAARPTAEPRDAAGVESGQKRGEAKGRATKRRRVRPKKKQGQRLSHET